jgi:hypothetical protein
VAELATTFPNTAPTRKSFADQLDELHDALEQHPISPGKADLGLLATRWSTLLGSD